MIKNINSFLHRLMIRYVMRAYAKKSKRVEKKHPELFRFVDAELARKHRELWSRLGVASGDRWLRLHVNITGIQDYTFCPEDIFFTRIERIMNDCDEAGHGPDDKSELYRFVPVENRPETVLRYVRGNFFDSALNWNKKRGHRCRDGFWSRQLVQKVFVVLHKFYLKRFCSCT